jgi:hypothetical protein
MSTQSPSNRMPFRRTTLKEWRKPVLFLMITLLAEILVVLYSISLGVKDDTLLRWSFTFPGTGLNTAIVISPLLNLVPIGVVLALVSSWTYLRRQMAIRPSGPQRRRPIDIKRPKGQKKTLSRRVTSIFSRKPVADLGKSTRFRGANLKSALMVFMVFFALMFMIALFTFPGQIYQAVAAIYESNPSLANFARGAGTAIGGAFSSINDALLSAAPGFGGFVLTIGLPIASLAALDNVGKYLVFQNGAAWTSTLIIFMYAKYGRKGSRQPRK